MDSPVRPLLHPRSASLLLALLLLLASAGAPAARVEGLYETEVPVAGSDAGQRNAAIRQALEKVLVKVSGSRQPDLLKRIGGRLKEAPDYVLQYSYRVDDGAAGGPDGEESRRLLRVSFDPEAVNRLLQQQGLPVWSENRPSVLLWLGSERNGRRRLLEPDPQSPVVKAVQQAARERGLPVLFPLMDLEDQAKLQVPDLWGDFESNIRAASDRYGADMILTGRLARVGKSLWRGEWRLYQPGRVVAFSNEAKDPAQLAATGIQQAADRLAAVFAPREAAGSGGPDTVRLRVGGITSLERFAAVTRLLDEQRGTERWSIVSVQPDAVVFDLHGRSGVEALGQVLSVGGVLEPDPDGTLLSDEDQGMIDLYFRIR